jgi:membrane associated rhomboid family serine protease
MLAQLPPVTKALLWANIAVFLLQQVAGPLLMPMALWPLGTGDSTGAFLPWQLVTYAFMHGSFMHLLFNMFAVYMFGAQLEESMGAKRYVRFYAICIVGAGLVQLVASTIAAQQGTVVPTVGASGGVFGLLVAYGVMYPHQKLMLIIPPIPVKAWVLVTGYGLLELVLGVTGTQPGVAHFAHLGGMAFGFVAIQHWRRRWPFRRRWGRG